ncbi:MAG: galactokinase [Pseudomonadota bacterium]|nr:galactokinase [Pseudomonadota bacterium]
MQAFEAHFGLRPEVVASAPGRVNLLGDHTDYNDGFVLPSIIAQTTTVALARSPDDSHHVYSTQLRSSVHFVHGDPPPHGFASYVYGCLVVAQESGAAVGPLSICIDSTVPVGAGLSSSAALEVAVLRALRIKYGMQLDDVKLALLAQAAEVRFAGVRCGIMDQMASSLGSPQHMLFLDTRTLGYRLLPLPDESELLIIDSGVPRQLSASGYNARRAECEQAARQLDVRALRDIVDTNAADQLPYPLNARARHVISEDNRVLAAANGVVADEFGRLMNASHASLRDDYAVSTAELDFLVESLQAHRDVYGARLTGAGFGGACVALVRPGRRDAVSATVIRAYRRRYDHPIVVY